MLILSAFKSRISSQLLNVERTRKPWINMVHVDDRLLEGTEKN